RDGGAAGDRATADGRYDRDVDGGRGAGGHGDDVRDAERRLDGDVEFQLPAGARATAEFVGIDHPRVAVGARVAAVGRAFVAGVRGAFVRHRISRIEDVRIRRLQVEDVRPPGASVQRTRASRSHAPRPVIKLPRAP